MASFASAPELSAVDCAVVAILTHGGKGSVLYGTDGESASRRTLGCLSGPAIFRTSQQCSPVNKIVTFDFDHNT